MPRKGGLHAWLVICRCGWGVTVPWPDQAAKRRTRHLEKHRADSSALVVERVVERRAAVTRVDHDFSTCRRCARTAPHRPQTSWSGVA
jgi:hypothetical protein